MANEIILEKTAIDENGIPQFEIAKLSRIDLIIMLVCRTILVGICFFSIYSGT